MAQFGPYYFSNQAKEIRDTSRFEGTSEVQRWKCFIKKQMYCVGGVKAKPLKGFQNENMVHVA